MRFTRKKTTIGIVIIVGILFIIAWRVASPSATRIGITDAPHSTRKLASSEAGIASSARSGMPAPILNKFSSGSVKITAPIQPSGEADFEEVTRADRLVIRSAQLSVVSKKVPAAVKELTEYVQSVGGFVVNIDLRGMNNAPSATVTMRVPVEQFNAALVKVRAIGLKIVSENISGQDVTEEYVDSEAQLKNLTASEQQFMEIMKRAENVEEVLLVQRQLEDVRGRIEQTKGRMQFLERSTKLALITVYLSTDAEDLPIVDPNDKWQPIVVIKDAFRAFLDLLKGLSNGVIWIVIFIPIWVPLLLIVWWYRKRRRNQPVSPSPVKKPTKNSPGTRLQR